jgi:hypothetical protein
MTGVSSGEVGISEKQKPTTAPNRRGAPYMDPKREAKIAQLANDIRSGMSDEELMEKYKTSSDALQKVFRKLVDMGAITSEEIDNRLRPFADSAFFRKMRELPRNFLVFPIPIHELGKYPEVAGMVRDITEKGLGVREIVTSIGETKTFTIIPNEMIPGEALTFQAVCRWSDTDEDGEPCAGFEISKISEDNLTRLRTLIKDLTFGEDM